MDNPMAEPVDLAQFKIKQNKDVIKQRDAAFIKRITWIAARRPWLKNGLSVVADVYEGIAEVNERVAELPSYIDKIITPRIKCITENNRGKARMALCDDNMFDSKGRPVGHYVLFTFSELTSAPEFPSSLPPHVVSIYTYLLKQWKAHNPIETLEWVPFVVIDLILTRLHKAGFRPSVAGQLDEYGRIHLTIRSRREEVRVLIDLKKMQHIQARHSKSLKVDPA